MQHRLTQLPNASLRLPSHAKLNLGLRIFPPRSDGYHDLETWMVPLSWHDTLTFLPSDQPLSLEITGRTENIPTDLAKNLVGRAALLLAQTANIAPTGQIQLHKILPPGGGIGGGSSNAANTLLALNEMWNLHLPPQTLHELAAQLGSDVPFFLKNQPTLCTGRGEIMKPLPAQNPLTAALILPPQGCPTKEVYQAFDRQAEAKIHNAELRTQNSRINWHQLAAARAAQLNDLLVNDLEPAAFHIAPQLADLRARAAAAIHRPVHMTGSGSTLFTLCTPGPDAQSLLSQLTPALPTCTLLLTRILR